MKKMLVGFLPFLVCFVLLAGANAQYSPGYGDNENTPPPPPDDPVDVPIDGGLTVMLAVAVGYGIKKGMSGKATAKESFEV